MQKPNDLARLHAKYNELLNSSLATWLFLDLTQYEFSGQVDFSTLNDDNQWSFMRFLPKFSTVTAALFASLSSDGTSLQLKEPKIYGRACGMTDVSPMRAVKVATVISNHRGNKGVMLVTLQEFMRVYRAQCIASYAQLADECRQQNVIIIKLLLLTRQDDSLLCAELQDLQQKFADLELGLLNPDDLKQYSPIIKKIIDQHYVELEILLNKWEEIEDEDRTQIFRLASAVQFFSLLLGDPSLISFVNYEQGLTYQVIGHRQALEYRLLHLQLNLQHNQSMDRAALREGYHTEIDKVLDGRESYVKLLQSVCIDPPIDVQGLCEGYKAISQALCFMDISNREQAPKIKKPLFQTAIDESVSKDSLLSFSEYQIIELKAFREMTVIVFLLKYLKDEMRPNKYGIEIESVLGSHLKYFTRISDLLRRILCLQRASCGLDVAIAQQQLTTLMMILYDQFHRGSEKFCGFIESKCGAIRLSALNYIQMSKNFFDANILDKAQFYSEHVQAVIDLENQVMQLMQYAEKYSVLNLDRKDLFTAISSRVTLVKILRNDLLEQFTLQYLPWINSVEATFLHNPTSMQELYAAQSLLQYLLINREALLGRLQCILPLEVRQLSKITEPMLKQKLLALSKSTILTDTMNALKAKKLEVIGKIKQIPGLYGVLCRYLAAVDGKQDPALLSEVNATFETLVEIENEIARVINEYSKFGADFTQEVSFLQEMLLQTQVLKARYDDVKLLINKIDSPNLRVVPRIPSAAKNGLSQLLGEMHSALTKSNAEFKELSNSIELNCNRSVNSPVNDLTLLFESLNLNNIAFIRSWITRFETDYNSCHNLIRLLKDYCHQLEQRIQDDDEPLGDILGPVVLATFSQIGFYLDYNARRNKHILVKLEEKLHSINAADLPSHSM